MGTVYLRSTTAPDGTYQNLGRVLTHGEVDNNMQLFLRNDVSDTMTGNLTVNGSVSATSKSFLIPHPTKDGMMLRYGSLEGPENGVYVRGRLTNENVIRLPEYWTKLIDPNSITVQLTAIDRHQKLYVESIEDNKVYVANDGFFSTEINCFYFVQAERNDIDKLQVEFSK